MECSVSPACALSIIETKLFQNLSTGLAEEVI